MVRITITILIIISSRHHNKINFQIALTSNKINPLLLLLLKAINSAHCSKSRSIIDERIFKNKLRSCFLVTPKHCNILMKNNWKNQGRTYSERITISNTICTFSRKLILNSSSIITLLLQKQQARMIICSMSKRYDKGIFFAGNLKHNWLRIEIRNKSIPLLVEYMHIKALHYNHQHHNQ